MNGFKINSVQYTVYIEGFQSAKFSSILRVEFWESGFATRCLE